MTLNSPQDVYARKLLSHRGYPLWTPEPNVRLPGCYRREGLKIGDVGVVVPEDGSFNVFFNLMLPRDHPLHAVDGVPNNFSQVELKYKDYEVVPDAESPGRVISSTAVDCTVTCTDPFYIDNTAHRVTNYQFSHGQNKGAMLILPQGAERHRLAETLPLLDIVIRNALDWYRFSREQLYQNISNDALYLITGFHKAQSWSLASFENDRPASTKCRIVQFRKAGPILPDDSTWETVLPLKWRIGPRQSGGLGIPNQTLFIVGFKITVNQELLHSKRATVKVDHSKRTLASTLVGVGTTLVNMLFGTSFGEANLPETISHDSVDSVPHLSQLFHPSDIINRYILRKKPSAKIAVTHDSQWIALLERGILKQDDILQVRRLEVAVSQEYDIVLKDGAAYLQNIVPSNPTSMDATACAVSDHHDTDPGTSRGRPSIPANLSPGVSGSNHNNNLTDQDVEMLIRATSVAQPISPYQPHHICQWMIGTGQGFCGSAVSPQDFSEHVRTCHGISSSDRTRAMCLWDNCFAEMKKESLMRHIHEKHLEWKYACPHCSEQFTRANTMHNHVARKHSDF